MKKNSKHPVEDKIIIQAPLDPNLVIDVEHDEEIIADVKLEAELRKAYYKRMQRMDELKMYKDAMKMKAAIEEGIMNKYAPVFEKLSKD